MTTLKLDGAEVFYRLEGRGERTLAFAHGWCTDSDDWAEVAGRFSVDHKVLLWDRRGMGRSSAIMPAHSADQHADDLAALLDAEQVDRVVLVAHAGAGPAALSFATRHVDRMAGLVLVDSGLYDPEGGAAEDAFAEAVTGWIASLSAPDADEFLGTTYASFFGPAAPSEVVEKACLDAIGTDRAVAIEELRHVLTDTKGLARTVSCPVMWVSVNPEDGPMAQGLFTDVMIGHPVGSGHFIQVEVPDQLEAMLRAFLSQR
jgi:pimeloyl-ACP methyl ester carboxylesterase